MSTLAVALVFLTVTGITISAVFAFWWAGKSGQFSEVELGAMSVFDADELESGQIIPENTHANPTLRIPH